MARIGGILGLIGDPVVLVPAEQVVQEGIDPLGTAIEIHPRLHEVLAAKGHAVEQADFLEYRGQYDRIVMNPPFENGQDIDHVRHAYDQLAPGARLVAIVSEGSFSRHDRKSEEFRAWLADRYAKVESLPEKAFAGREAFRQTGVQARINVVGRA